MAGREARWWAAGPGPAQDLGLRDFARMDGWVLLPLSTAGMEDILPSREDVAAMEAGREVDEDETVAAQAALEREGDQA